MNLLQPVQFMHCGKLCVGTVIAHNTATPRQYQVQWGSKVGKHIQWFNHQELTIK
jgi:hypothetical protein